MFPASNMFALFVVLVCIAFINVMLVWFVWDQLLLKPPQQIQSSLLASETFFPRKHFAAEHWTRDFAKCQIEDCNYIKSICVDHTAVEWTANDLKSCYSGLLVPKSAKQCPSNSSHNTASCEMNPPVPLPPSCTTTNNKLKVYLDGENDQFLRDIGTILFRDLSFSKGYGASVLRATSKQDANLVIQVTKSSQKSRILESFDPETCQSVISLRDVGTKAKPQELYNAAVRSAVGELIQRQRPRLSSSQLSIAVLLVWAGNKPPPHALFDVAQSFTRASPVFTVFIAVENTQHAEYFTVNNPNPNKIRMINVQNLTAFIHTRTAELVPEVKPDQHHYTLGWSLCDFRWLFGAIFQDYIPEEEFTHWAWADSDAYVSSDVFGPITDYGQDFMRHDVTSFAAVIYGRASKMASTMMGYTSGTFTAVINNEHGRNLFRHTPIARLKRGLVNPSNGVLDEAVTSNAVLSAANVTVALIGSQCRSAGTVLCRKTGKLFYIVQDEEDAIQLERLRVLGRVGTDPYAAASVSDSRTQVLGRFVGGSPLSLQHETSNYFDPAYPKWYTPPVVNPDSFLSLDSQGVGFSTLLRDAEGNWFARPLPHYAFHRSNHRSADKQRIFYYERPLVRIELSIVHSRIAGGACEVWDASVFDWTSATRSSLSGNPFVDERSPQCKPFRSFFKK